MRTISVHSKISINKQRFTMKCVYKNKMQFSTMLNNNYAENTLRKYLQEHSCRLKEETNS